MSPMAGAKKKKKIIDEIEQNTSRRPGLFLVDHLQCSQGSHPSLGPAGPDDRARSAVLLKEQLGLLAGRPGSECSRLDPTSLFWVTKSDVRGAGI